MEGNTSNPTCAKCGNQVPATAAFCPNCGSAIAAASATIAAKHAEAPTILPTLAPTIGPNETIKTPSNPAEAQTISPSLVRTSLDLPSPRPPTRGGDGPFVPGQQVGPRYTILKLLGTGGMGAVYQAFDHELGVAVAIKVIRPSAQSDATAAKELENRFKRELVLARQVTHKYVVRIHDLGEIDGIKYLTMPFVEGETLAQVLRKSDTLPLDRVIKIAQQIAQGLAAAHEKGVVHRDLKPENIMLERASEDPVPNGGDALIMDFGIARSVEQGATQTLAGSVIGTLEYMAPEQAHGKKVDGRADQYALGLIIYDMLAGRSQRMAGRDSPMAELLERMIAAPKRLREINRDIPETVDAIVMKMLSPNPDDRYPSTAAVTNLLDHLTPDGSIRSDFHEVIIHDAPARSKLAIAALLIVLVGGAAGYLISRQSRGAVAPAVQEPVSVLIGDFNNRTGDAMFDGVVEQALGLGIEGASFINAYPRRDALRIASAIKPGAKLDEDTAKLVAIREGIGTVVTGEIESKDGGYHIRIRSVGGDGSVRHTLEDDAASKADVLATVGELAGRVRQALGDTSVPKEGLDARETFTAASLEAARAYVQAQELQASGKPEEAIKQYEEAIRLDPEMGRAYSGLATQLLNLGRIADAEKYFQQALARIDRMTDREKFRTRGGFYVFARKPQQAVQEFSSLVAAYPGDSTGLGNLAFAHSQLRNFSEAMTVGRRASALLPSNVIRRNNAALYAMYAGEFETALSDSNEVSKINPSYVRAYVTRALSSMALGRTADAVKAFEDVKGISAAGASFAFAGLADIALYEGRTADAIAILKQGIAADTASKSATGRALKHVAMADAMLARGDASAAAREAETALTIDQTDPVALTAGLVLAKAGRRAAAESVAQKLSQKLEADPQAYAELIQAEIGLSQKQPRVAIERVRAAQKLADSWIGRVIAARSLIEAGAFAEASSEIDAAIKRKGEATAITLDEWPTFRYFPQVYFYKGLALDGLKSPAARDNFETFLAIKAKGDETAGLVADARKKIAELPARAGSTP